ncbi:M56 family metallopeptidase [Catenovulum agarivorans]|uniref:M56 family metallopeptidase n=1 Tax=Catenovulum agarivorans TaxID=1172192 RepID=UPI00036E3E68|nr:M56 family metallopeptidase [Catenovulum agarivorans]
MDYIITNLAITLVMLAAVKSMADAPARIQLSLLLVALFGWFIPWHAVEITLVNNIQLIPSNIDYILPNFDALLEANKAAAQFESSQTSASFYQQTLQTVYNINFSDFFLLAIGFGLTWFLLDIVRYRAYLAKLNKTAQNANQILVNQNYSQKLLFNRQIQLQISPLVPTAMATGTLKPVIWLNKEAVNSAELNSILLHEITHLEKFDPLLKWLTQLAKRIFFWNPLVIVLLKKIDLLIEMRCDQNCFEIKREQYCIDLAQIILNSQQQLKKLDVNVSGFTSINNQANANITRLESLSKEKPMKMKFIAIATCSILFSSIAGAHINSATTAKFRSFPESIDLHQFALDTKARRENVQKLKIYLPETENNSAYNTQMKQLVELSENALTPNTNELNEIVHNIESWYANRQQLSPWQEQRIKLHTFSIQHFLLQKQRKNAEIVTLTNTLFGSLEALPQAYRHRTASALMHQQQNEQALNILAQFNFDDAKVAIGNVILTVDAYMLQGEYENALNLLDKRLALQPNNQDLVRLLTVKYQVLNFIGDQAQADEIKQTLENQYNVNRVKTRDFANHPVRLHWAPVLDHI